MAARWRGVRRELRAVAPWVRNASDVTAVICAAGKLGCHNVMRVVDLVQRGEITEGDIH